MKKTLAVVTFLAILAITASSVFARGGGYGYCERGEGRGGGFGYCEESRPEMRGQPFHFLDRMQYYLGLSDAQVDKIYQINRDYQDKYYQNRKSYDKIQSLREEHKKAIEKVFTKEQKEKWEKFRENHPRKEWRHGPKRDYKK